MKRRTEIQPQLTIRAAGMHRLWSVEALEQRLLLSGVADAFGVHKIKFTDVDGDKVQIKLSSKADNFDITFDRDLGGNVLGINTLTLHGSDASAQLNFILKPARSGASDSTVLVGSIVSGAGDTNLSLAGLNATNAQISHIALSGSIGNEPSDGQFSGSIVTNRDLGSVSVGGLLANITIQGGHNLTGNVSASQIGRIIATGGDLFGNITTTSGIGALSSIQADDMSGNVTATGIFTTLTLTGNLSGDVMFGKGTLVVLIGGDLAGTGSIVGFDPGAGLANIDAGGFTRTGIVGNVAGLLGAEGALGLGAGGSLQGSASVSAGGDLAVKANAMSSNLVTLASTGGDVYVAMNTGGFAGAINSADDVFGNGSNGALVIRGGNFGGAINAGGDVAAMTFLPSSGGFTGSIVAGGIVNNITANFFGSTASITGASIGNLTVNRNNAGDAIALGASFHATGLVGGNIGNVTATALGSIALGGSFTSDHGNIGAISATSTGNANADHAISNATVTATEGSIGAVTATAKAGHGISDSTFTAATGIGNVSASSTTGNGFNASGASQTLFTVTNGSIGNINGASVSGDGFHGSRFTASGNIGNVNGTSASGSGIGDPTGAVTTFFAATGSISSIKGTATGGGAGTGGDGLVNVTATAGQDEGGLGFGAIQGSSQFGSGIVGSGFSAEGSIASIVGTTNNTNPSVDEDGINTTVFRTAGDIQEVTASTGVTGGSGVGSAIEQSLFSAAGSIVQPSASTNAPAKAAPSGPLASTTLIDNDIPLATLSHWDVDVQTGGESRSAQLTASRLASGDIVTEEVLFDYFSYVDTGNNGGGFQLSTGADPVQVGGDPDKVESTGSFIGAAGNTINYKVTSSIDDGDSVMFSTFTFTAQTGSLGVFRFMQYLDEDIEGVSDDVLYYTGSAATNDLELFTFDNDEVYGVSHSGSLSAGQGLVNSTFAGWAADEFNDMKPQIAGAGQPVSLGGVIDLADLPAFTHPVLGAVNGPADIVSVLAWDVDPNATTATIITTLGGVPKPPAPPPPPIPLGDCDDHSSNLPIVISVMGDIRDTQFLAGYDIGADLSFDGTLNDASEVGAHDPVVLGSIRVTGDWINSFAASGISSMDGQMGNGDDTLSAPGSALGNILVTSNIAGDVDNPGSPLTDGDVFLAVGEGTIEWRHADGTLVRNLHADVVGNSFVVGMAFDASGSLYATMFDSDAVSVFSPAGTFTGTFGTDFDATPESILFDQDGNAYVGQADGTHEILKFDSEGNLLATYSPATEGRGTDWIDLAADQHTIFYTSEGDHIKRFDVASDTQLPDFNAQPLPGTAALALRINPADGGVFVADTESILRLDSDGTVIQEYDVPGQDDWFALNLDPDGTSFWSGNAHTGDVFKFDIATGDVLVQFTVEPRTVLGGIVVKGELTAGAGGSGVGGGIVNYFQSDSIGTFAADAIGMDPNSGSVEAPIGAFTNFSNGIVGSIGDIVASTSTQRQAIASGTVFVAGTSIACISAANDNTSFVDVEAIGFVTFKAGTSIGDITASTDPAQFATTINAATFMAHDNDSSTGLAIGTVTVTGGKMAAIAESLFDASDPTVTGRALNIGTIDTEGSITDSTFIATGGVASGLLGIDGCFSVVSPGPLQITGTQDGDAMVNALFSGMLPDGITIDNVSLVAPTDPDDSSQSAVGLFKGFPLLPVGTTQQLPDGIILTSGLASTALGPNDSGGESTSNTGTNDASLDGLNPDPDNTAGQPDTLDASSLTITFTNTSAVQSLSALFVFGSEEFAEFVNSPFNDIFGVFLDGVNISNDPNGNILNVNNNFFLLNNTAENPPTDFTGADLAGTTQVFLSDLQYDGLTPVLQVSTPGVLAPGTHTLKFAIADVGDSILDSGVFIARLCASGQPGGGGTDLPAVPPASMIVNGSLLNSHFTADSDDNGSGSLAGAGGISITGGQIFESTFHAGSNELSTGLAIGDITLVSPTFYGGAVSDSTFTTGLGPDANIGKVNIEGSIVGTTFAATGGIGDITLHSPNPFSAAIGTAFGGATSFLADSDSDGDGDIGSIIAKTAPNATITGVNVALTASDLAQTPGIAFSEGASGLDVTATEGSIGSLAISGSEVASDGATNVHFHAAKDIGTISITLNSSSGAGSAIGNSEFIAGESDPTGKIGDITLSNANSLNSADVISNVDFVSGSGGIGDISVVTAGKGRGIADSVFRAGGVTDLTHKANIGNIIVTTVPLGENLPNDGLSNTVFSAVGNIGTGAGATGDFHIQIAGNVRNSKLLAGYDIGDNLVFDGFVLVTDDALSSAVTFINSITVTDRFIASDIVAGVNPGDNIFGNFNDSSHVVGSSLGSIQFGGTADAAANPGQGGFVVQHPLNDRLHAIEADLIGSIKVAGIEEVSDLPGYLDNAGASNQVNIEVL